jgi:pimeloyl-ACP methyl ester carboxylesterase
MRSRMGMWCGLAAPLAAMSLVLADEPFEPIDPAPYFESEGFGMPFLSPDGEVLGFSHDGVQYFFRAADMNPLRRFDSAWRVSGSAVTWIGPRRIAYGRPRFSSFSELMSMMGFSGPSFTFVDLDTGEIDANYRSQRYTRVVCANPADPDTIIAAKVQYRIYEALYLVSTVRQRQRKLADEERQVRTWLTDPECGVRARIQQPDEEGAYSLAVPNGDEWTVIREVPAGSSMITYGTAGEEHDLVWLLEGSAESGRIPRLVDLVDGGVVMELSAPGEMQISGWASHLSDGGTSYEIDAVEWLGPDPGRTYANPELGALMSELEAAFPDRRVRLSSRSDDGSVLALRITDAVHPTEYYLFDGESGSVRYLYGRAEGLPAVRDIETTMAQAPSPDGLEIPYWVTARRGLAADAPVVVLIQAKPYEWNWVDAYSPGRRLLAEAGFRVIEVDPRGSPNYPTSYRQAGIGDLSAIGQDFVTALDHAVGNDTPACVMGGVDGGYLAALVASVGSERFRCAAFQWRVDEFLTFESILDLVFYVGMTPSEFLGFEENVETEDLPSEWQLEGIAQQLPPRLMLAEAAGYHDNNSEYAGWDRSLSKLLEGREGVTWLPMWTGETQSSEARIRQHFQEDLVAIQRFMYESMSD